VPGTWLDLWGLSDAPQQSLGLNAMPTSWGTAEPGLALPGRVMADVVDAARPACGAWEGGLGSRLAANADVVDWTTSSAIMMATRAAALRSRSINVCPPRIR
jgi:hypothetical protein